MAEVQGFHENQGTPSDLWNVRNTLENSCWELTRLRPRLIEPIARVACSFADLLGNRLIV
jgi:hypothetical protein